MTLEIKAPGKLKKLKNSKTIFMAGSIDMGKAIDWQKQLKESFKYEKRITFWNPRRENWDSSWLQDINFVPFKEQVMWELNALEKSDIIVYYFDPKGQAPITLLELGLHVKSGKPIIVCCPKGFWRKGNVDIVCEKYGITLCETMDDMIEHIKEVI